MGESLSETAIRSLESQLKELVDCVIAMANEEQRVREYIFSILTEKQIEEYLDWEDSDAGA